MLGSGAVTNVLYRPALQELRDEIELAGVADLNQQSAEHLLKEFPAAEFFTDYRAMLQELRPDAVIVALPHFLHKPASIDALRMGIHVFCEKPMAISSAECDQIEAAVRETGGIFSVNLTRRSFSQRAGNQTLDRVRRARCAHFFRSHRRRALWLARHVIFIF